MRKLMLACAALALVSGIVSVTLWRELRDERGRTAELRALVAEAEQRVPGPQLTVSTPAGPAGGPAPASSEAGAVDARPAPAPPPATRALQPINLNSQELMKDPEYRKAMLAQRRMSLPQSYPGLAEELGLTPEEVNRLFDLIAENQLERSSAAIRFDGNTPPDPALLEQMRQQQEESQRKLDESIASLLGEAKLAQYKEYVPTQSSRMRAAEMGRTMGALGRPLSDAQLRPLTAAFIAEQNRQREDAQAMSREFMQQGGAPDRERLEEVNFRRQQESNRRLVDAVRPHLDTRQLETLQSSLDQQLAINRASTRALRAQMEAAGSTTVTTVNSVVILGGAAVPPVPPPPPQP